MILVGLTCQPLSFCTALKNLKQPYSVNTINGTKNVVCTSFEEFKKLKLKDTKKRVFLFDAIERLSMIQNIVIIKLKSPELCAKKGVKELKHVEVSIKNRNYIQETIDSNNDSSISFMHDYNTNLYNITSVAVRDLVRGFYFDYLHQRISKEMALKEIQALYPKRGKSVEAFDYLISLFDSNLFKQTQKAIKDSQGKHDRELDQVAKDNRISIFDLRYWLNSKK